MFKNNSPKIVLVDDDIFCLSVYEQEILSLGFTNVTKYSSGTELINNLHLRPDIIFLDYNLGDIKGLKLLQQIKKINPNIYVVIVSGQSDMDITVELLKNGAFDYIVKDESETQKIAVLLAKWLSAREYRKNVGFDIIADQSEKYVKIILQAQDNVRKEIANELHDNVSQLLGAAKLYIDTGIKKDEDERLEMLVEASSILNSAISELRKLCHGLHAINIYNQNLEQELEKIFFDLKKQSRYNLQTKVSAAKINKTIPGIVQHEVIRMIQEMTNNMVKYASAKNVDISVIANKANLHLQFVDDGVGFDLEKTVKGMGLNNIIKRVAGIRGKYQIETSPGKGCCWKIQIPIEHHTLV
jgi:signal transduction histidine kinase